MLKQFVSIVTIFCMFTYNTYAAELIVIDELSGLARNPTADKIANGAHTRFTNLYIKDGNINVVKGRDRLSSTSATDTTVKGFFYYENAAGTTTKLIVKENDEVVSYDIDGTNRTSLIASLTNETIDAVQIGDTLYFTSSTDGLHKWTGSGSAVAVGSVSAPSSVTFTASTTTGGMTSGFDALVESKLTTISVTSSGAFEDETGCSVGPATRSRTCDSQTAKTDILCTAESGCSAACGAGVLATTFCPGSWTKSCATSSIYQYKIVKYNNVVGIESEPSSASSVSLEGANQFDTITDASVKSYSSSTTCASGGATIVISHIAVLDIDQRQTSTTGTLVSAPSDPFNVFRIYRTVATGEDYFLLGEQDTGTYTDGKADISLDTALDTTIDTISPPSFRYITEYKGTIFTAEGSKIRFTRVPVQITDDADKYWLETDELDTGAIKPITGLHTTSDSLLIFTNNRTVELTGFGVTSFRQRVLFEGVGTVADETIETDTNGDIIFFAGTQGVYKLQTRAPLQDDVTGAVVGQTRTKLTKVSSPNLDEVFRGTDNEIDLDPNDYTSSHAYYDLDNDLYFLYIGQDSFIFDNVNSTWSYIPATQMIGSFYRKSPNKEGVGVLADNSGFFFNNWTGYENGIESGTLTGNSTSSTNTTLTDSSVTFNTTNDGLKSLWVYIDNANREYRQITSNTATLLTVSSAWTTNPITADDYYITYIIPDLLTKVYSLAKPPDITEIENFWLINEKADSEQEVLIFSFSNKETEATGGIPIDVSLKFINKITSSLNSEFVQWGLQSFVYNTSNTINTPINIISYAFKGTVEDAK